MLTLLGHPALGRSSPKQSPHPATASQGTVQELEPTEQPEMSVRIIDQGLSPNNDRNASPFQTDKIPNPVKGISC